MENRATFHCQGLTLGQALTLSKIKKSLISYSQKYHPELIFRCSPRNFTRDEKFINLPVYAGFLMKGQ